MKFFYYIVKTVEKKTYFYKIFYEAGYDIHNLYTYLKHVFLSVLAI